MRDSLVLKCYFLKFFVSFNTVYFVIDIITEIEIKNFLVCHRKLFLLFDRLYPQFKPIHFFHRRRNGIFAGERFRRVLCHHHSRLV